MARGDAGAPGSLGSGARRALRLAAANQRLLILPVAGQLVTALLALPVVLAARDGVTFAVFARDAAETDRFYVDVLGEPRTTDLTFAAIVAAIIAGAVVNALVGGALIRSLGEGRTRLWVGGRAFVALTAIWLVGGFAGLAVTALGDSPYSLLLLLLLLVPLLYADYAVVLEERSLWAAMARSARLIGRRPGQTLLVLLAVQLLGALLAVVFIDPLDGADGIFPGFFGALLLAVGGLDYLVTCALVAIVLENPVSEP